MKQMFIFFFPLFIIFFIYLLYLIGLLYVAKHDLRLCGDA